MQFMFPTDTDFSFQTLRAVSCIPYDGADVGEVMATAARITAGDWESWFSEWHALAKRTEDIATAASDSGHRESARCAYLRASNYYREAEFYLRDDPVGDPRAMAAWQSSVDSFRAALKVSQIRSQQVAIPYEDAELRGYYLRPGDTEPRPTLLALGGFDSTLEELYFAAGAAALRRGWNCLMFEGPGQGAALRVHGLTFRPDYEAVVTPVLDYTLALPAVDPDRIALLGASLGGLLAPRAAAHENRLAACVAWGGPFSLLASLSDNLQGTAVGADGDASANDAVAQLDDLITRRRQLPTHQRWMLSHGIWTLGASTAVPLLTALSQYDLTGVAGKITCPTLVCTAEADQFVPGGSDRLYDELVCDKRLITFTAVEGAEEHCNVGALTLAHQRIFDWLDDVVIRAGG